MMIPKTMRAWEVTTPGPIEQDPCPLQLVEKPVPEPQSGEVLVKI